MSTESLLTRSSDERSPSLAAALEALRAAPREQQATTYESLVFPFAVDAARDAAAETPEADLLIVPIGTQPYSPLLAILSCRAKNVALLVTEPQAADRGLGSPGSRPTAHRVLQALQSNTTTDLPVLELFSIGDGTQGEQVVAAVGAALLWAGDPWPQDVTVDISGGRKSTTAALGGIAAVLGFRLSYIEGQHVINGYYAGERRHALTDVAALLEVERRYAATQLLLAGAYPAAEAELEAVLQTTIATPAAWLLHRVAHALRTAAPLSEVAQDFRDTLPDARRWQSILDILEGEHPSAASVTTRLIEQLRQDGTWR